MSTGPTHEMVTLSALNMSASALHFANPDLTPRVRAQFSTFPEVKLSELVFKLDVVNLNLFNNTFVFRNEI